MKYVLCAVILLWVSLAPALSLPKNAHVKLFEPGWECDRGFFLKDGQCLPLAIPEHARIDLAGNGWECESGYVRKAQACVHVEAPPDAQIDPFGNGWNCNWGYYKDGDQCRRVIIPSYGVLNDLGNGWECAREFKRVGDICVGMTTKEKEEQQRSYLENMPEEQRPKGPETPFCQTAYNKCTASCPGMVYAYSASKELKSPDFMDRCIRACVDGRQGCADADSSCDVFSSSCSRHCPNEVVDGDSGVTLKETDAHRVCENACQLGGRWCKDQRRRISRQH